MRIQSTGCRTYANFVGAVSEATVIRDRRVRARAIGGLLDDWMSVTICTLFQPATSFSCSSTKALSLSTDCVRLSVFSLLSSLLCAFLSLSCFGWLLSGSGLGHLD
jgi:hypothetical protein